MGRTRRTPLRRPWTLRAAPALAVVALAATAVGGSAAEQAGAPALRPVAAWTPWLGEGAMPSNSSPATSDAAERPAGRAVSAWIELLTETLGKRQRKDPPAAARAYAYLSVAMCDAAVAAARRGGDPALTDAAVAGAAAAVLTELFPERPAAEFAARARAAAGDGSEAAAGLSLGRAVGAAAARRIRGDGFGRPWAGSPPRGRHRWSPPRGTPAGTPSKPLEPLAGQWRTWLLRSGSDVRPGPPPRYGSRAFRAEAREVLRMRATLTPERRRAARVWAGVGTNVLPPGVWNAIALERLGQAGWGTARAARALALLNVAVADAGIAGWDAKYVYWSPRPENAIPSLGLARRFKPYLPTPPFPGYVSGHAVFSGAAAEVLAHLFPDAAGALRARAVEAAESRLWGGIHFRSDSTVGLDMGRRIGQLAVARARDTELH